MIVVLFQVLVMDLAAANDARKKRLKPKDRALAEIAEDLIAGGGEESVSVCVRVRPFNHREMEIQGHSGQVMRSVVEMPDGLAGKLRLLHRDDNNDYHEVEVFHFSRTFWSVGEDQQPHKYQPITQEDVFQVVGRSVVTNALGGFNVCVFAYGQTGSGKTHTMMGDVHTSGDEFTGDPGLIPRLCRELFAASSKRMQEASAENERAHLSVDIKLSALEIYNEQVRDLFWKGSAFAGRTKLTTLKIRKHPTEGHFVDELTTLNPKSWPECVQLIAAGLSERTVAATLMNDESSRSHSVFQIIVTQTETIAPPPQSPYDKPVVTTRVSRVNLVDLAGSERLKKSGAQGQQLKEAAGINQSLSTLKKVIDALVQNSTEKNTKKHVLVPYRESALTQLLSHSLGGNSKTTMIACVSPHYDNQEETLLTLRYANRAKGIVNHVKSNENNAARQEKLLKDQLAALQARLSEGPQVLTEAQLADLRDQLLIGSKALEDMQGQHAAQEREAARLAEVLRGQRDARYSSTYYSCFKRVLLERVRDRSQGKLKSLEVQLARAASEKEHLVHASSTRERSVRDTEYTIQELQRKEELWHLRTARNEALARQLVRDIAKAKRKADENLMSRFGLVWIKDRNIKALRQSVAAQKETAQREHDQYLQSIVREAKRQFDYLCATYAEKDAAQRERLAAVERRQEHAQQQLEKSQHLLFSLQSSYERASAEHQRREKERQTSWLKRFEDMRVLYEEKLSQLDDRHRAFEQSWQQRLDVTQREAAATHNARVEDLHVQLQTIESEGLRRYNDVTCEMDAQLSSLREKCVCDGSRAAAELFGSFEADERALTHAICTAQTTLRNKRSRLESLYRYASNIESSARHAENALQMPHLSADDLPLDAALLRADAAAFLLKYKAQESRLQTHMAALILRKSAALASCESL